MDNLGLIAAFAAQLIQQDRKCAMMPGVLFQFALNPDSSLAKLHQPFKRSTAFVGAALAAIDATMNFTTLRGKPRPHGRLLF